MSQKQIYVPPEGKVVLDDLVEILKKKDKSFSHWILEQAMAYIREANSGVTLKIEPEVPQRLCMAGNVKGSPCEVGICRQLSSMHGYGLVAQEKEFAKFKEHCIFSNYASST